MKKLLAGVAITGLGLALMPTLVHAEDFGDWSRGCSSGYVCFYEVGPADGVVNKAMSRDSNFSNNLSYSNGDNMNDHVNYISNLFVSNISIQAYTGSSYVGATGYCLTHGTAESPLSSISSYKAC